MQATSLNVEKCLRSARKKLHKNVSTDLLVAFWSALDACTEVHAKHSCHCQSLMGVSH